MSPRIVDREEKKRRIIEAALRVFAEKGFQSAKMADIAQAAGIGKGTVYEYFPSKEEMVEAIFAALLTDFGARIDAMGNREGSALDGILAIVRETMAQAEEFAPFMPVYFQIMGARLSDRDDATHELGDGFSHAGKALAKLIRAGSARGEIDPEIDAEAFGRMLISALDGLALHIGLFGFSRKFMTRQQKSLEDMIIAALRPPAKGKK